MQVLGRVALFPSHQSMYSGSNIIAVYCCFQITQVYISTVQQQNGEGRREMPWKVCKGQAESG